MLTSQIHLGQQNTYLKNAYKKCNTNDIRGSFKKYINNVAVKSKTFLKIKFNTWKDSKSYILSTSDVSINQVEQSSLYSIIKTACSYATEHPNVITIASQRCRSYLLKMFPSKYHLRVCVLFITLKKLSIFSIHYFAKELQA